MNLMLLALFAAVGVGLFSRRLGRFEPALIVVIASTLTLVYFFRPYYMT
jgi:hypothetical protein